MTEIRKMKLLVNKAGGNAGKNSCNFRVSLPASWIREMGLSEDVRNLKLSFDGEKIIVEKENEEMERVLELIEKEFLTIEEMQELCDSAYVDNWENNGNSGQHNGCTWVTVVVDGEEYDVYEKA